MIFLPCASTFGAIDRQSLKARRLEARFDAEERSVGHKRQISWQVDGDNRLHLRWVESGGPSVSPPAITGYGTKLIQSATTYNLGGQVEQNYAARGLKVQIVIQLEIGALPG